MVINLDFGKMVVSIEINGSEYFSKRRWEVSLKQDDTRPGENYSCGERSVARPVSNQHCKL
jgi:hypothetical protein